MHRIVLSLLAAFVLYSSPATAEETTLGRWCDRMVPTNPKSNREITIKVTASGDTIAAYRFVSSAAREAELIEQTGARYLVKDSSHGDGYRIVPSSGELQLIDRDGLIRVASRLEKSPQPGDCLP